MAIHSKLTVRLYEIECSELGNSKQHGLKGDIIIISKTSRRYSSGRLELLYPPSGLAITEHCKGYEVLRSVVPISAFDPVYRTEDSLMIN